MRLIKKGTLFRRPIIEMTDEEAEAYNLGIHLGWAEGFALGIGLSMIVYSLTKIIGL